LYKIRLTSQDLLRCRFAISPVWETGGAIRVLHDPQMQPFHLPWLRSARERPAGLDLAPLSALQPTRGWTPDFLSPPPLGPEATIEEDLAAVRTTDPGQVRDELLRTLCDQKNPQAQAEIRRMAEDPVAARDRLADLLHACWELMIAPHWPHIRDLLDADIAHHARILAEGGLESLVPELDRTFSWRDDSLLVSRAHQGVETYDFHGRGLVLMPSAFIWPYTALGTDATVQPVLAYAARGIAELWQRAPVPPDAIAHLLGATRAELLTALTDPTSTTALARRHNLSPSTVSAHLTVLRNAALITARRHRRHVLYVRTPLGTALLGQVP
jgi:DNA-binding transcriptional ArsR family regulator